MQSKTKATTYLKHLLLFVLTLITTIMVGAELCVNRPWFGAGENNLSLADWTSGLPYSLAFIAFLTFHEFGHYFTAVYHKVRTSLPFYIPLYIPGVINIGSLGAVIRLKQIPESTRKFFDIGIAGPLAGFVVSLFLLVWGFTHLPDKEAYLLPINPDYTTIFGHVPSEAEMMTYIEREAFKVDSIAQVLDQPVEVRAYYHVGTSLIFEWLKDWLADPEQVPNHFDLIHYPFLFVGYITLFFTALNLLPMGQLDGGHIIYGMFGPNVGGIVARVSLLVLILMGGTGLVSLETGDWLYMTFQILYIPFLFVLCRKILNKQDLLAQVMLTMSILIIQAGIKWAYPELEMNFIWLLYSAMVSFLVGLDHPEAYLEHRVNTPRQLLGWLAIIIFILCFTPAPLDVVLG